MGIMLPVASGKGGVGKSVFATNLGVALAELGKTVVLVDLDLGGANLHTLLGIKNRHAGLGGLVYHTEASVESLIVETGIPRLFFIPGDTLLPGTANLEFFTKRKILRGLAALPADYVLMDLGAGSSYNVVDFFLSSSSGLIVTVPEITAVLNAYSFLKTALFRALFRSFPPKGPERKMIVDFVSKKIEGTDESFKTLAERLVAEFPATAPSAVAQIAQLYPRVVLNMGRSSRDLAIGARLRDIVARNLGINIEYVGFTPKDESIPHSVVERRPTLLAHPNAPYAATVRAIARRIVETPIPAAPRLYQDNEDLVAVAEEGLSAAQIVVEDAAE
ncbi:MAG: P-loop NTPase [Treponemataceae bacterium]